MMWTAFALILTATQATWLGPPPQKPMTRVITLAPSLTETVLALGAQDTLVGVSRFCDFPAVSHLPQAGGFSDIAEETVVSLKPGLVIVQKAPGNQKAVESLARLGISVLALPLTTVDDIAVAFREIGAVLGKTKEAQQQIEALQLARDAARDSRAAKKKRVLFVVGFSPLVVAGPGSFAHELLEDCGAVNAAQRGPSPYPTFSLERAAALAPELIIDAANVHEGRKALEQLGPLRKSQWVTLPSPALLQPGPSLAKALPSLCELIQK